MAPQIQAHPGGVTFLELKLKGGEPLPFQVPGSFVWLNIPSIHPLEWHPFSISSSPTDGPSWTHHIRSVHREEEGQIRPNEWTERLHALAGRANALETKVRRLPGTQRQVSAMAGGDAYRPWYNGQVYFDGPYGVEAFPAELGDAKDVVFIAAGAGVTKPLAHLLQVVGGAA